MAHPRSQWSSLVAIAVVVSITGTPPPRAAGRRFFSSLGIARAQAVTGVFGSFGETVAVTLTGKL